MAVGPAISNWTVQDFILFSKLTGQAFLRRELREHTIVPKPGATLDLKIRDDDAWVRGSTVLAQSDALVKGDKDLLDVAESSPIPILSPRDCWQWLRG